MKNSEVLNIDGEKTLLTRDESEDLYVMSLIGEGGPIVSDKNREVLIAKFKEGMKIAKAVRKLLYFEQTGNWLIDE